MPLRWLSPYKVPLRFRDGSTVVYIKHPGYPSEVLGESSSEEEEEQEKEEVIAPSPPKKARLGGGVSSCLGSRTRGRGEYLAWLAVCGKERGEYLAGREST